MCCDLCKKIIWPWQSIYLGDEEHTHAKCHHFFLRDELRSKIWQHTMTLTRANWTLQEASRTIYSYPINPDYLVPDPYTFDRP